MRIAIDGPSGSGKSTVARKLASRCGLTYLDTGAMYRAIACQAAHLGLDFEDEDSIAELARKATIRFGEADDASQTVSIDGRDVTVEIRTPEADRWVTPVSAMPEVREAMVALQREMGRSGDVVAEGRDIGTVVFPNAELKVFLVADPAARAKRRAVQRAGGDVASGKDVEVDDTEVQAILDDLLRRDKADSTREASPLRPADDAYKIDSSELSVDEVIDAIIDLNPTLKLRAQQISE